MAFNDDGSDCEYSRSENAKFSSSFLLYIAAIFSTPISTDDYDNLEAGPSNQTSDDNHSTIKGNASTVSILNNHPIASNTENDAQSTISTISTQSTEPKVSNSSEYDLNYAAVYVFGLLILSTVIGIIISCSKGECNITDDLYNSTSTLT